jgi:hypothetical protein
MKTKLASIKIGLGIIVAAVAVTVVLLVLPEQKSAQLPGSTKLVAENAILAGLPAGALFPFIDVTPNGMTSVHIALTDATSNCAAGAAPPTNLQVLAGEAGVALVPVMSASTNTGIGSNSQCVFHVTVTAGHDGIPKEVTDIVVVNVGAAALTAFNTITVTAEVR